MIKFSRIRNNFSVRESTKAQKAACVTVGSWRNREAFSVQRVDGKKLLWQVSARKQERFVMS